MKYLIHYLYCHKKSIMFGILMTVVFMIVLILYQINLEPLFYAAGLVLLLAIILITYDYSRYYKKRELIEKLCEIQPLDINNLPYVNTAYEKEYQSLVKTLNKVIKDDKSSYDRSVFDANEYYMMWAHQIKTPIQATRLLLESDDVNIDDLSEQLFKIEEYVGMVLEYLKTDDLSSDLVLSRYKLDSLIKQSVKKYSKLFIKKKIKLNYTKTDYDVLTDGKLFCFVIEQLLSNALKYTNKGSVSIYMEANTLVIEDTGIGIATEDIPRLFQRGFTGYNGHKNTKSTGIGLYLCKKICDRLGHRISIYSEPNKGCRVMIGLDRYEISE